MSFMAGIGIPNRINSEDKYELQATDITLPVILTLFLTIELVLINCGAYKLHIEGLFCYDGLYIFSGLHRPPLVVITFNN